MHVMRAALHLALALTLAAPLPAAAGEEPLTAEEALVETRKAGVIFGSQGGLLGRCDPAYDTAARRSIAEALAGRPDLWWEFSKVRSTIMAKVAPLVDRVPPETIDCAYHRGLTSVGLSIFLELAPRLR